MNPSRWLILGGVTGLLAVLFGAFGAHGIEEVIPSWYTQKDLSPISDGTGENPPHSSLPIWYQLDQLHQKKLQTWMTGVRYHFYHTLAILAVGLLVERYRRKRRLLDFAGACFLVGMIGFSGSIYIYVISKVKLFGMTAALGGVFLMAGWLFFSLGLIQLLRPIAHDDSQTPEP